MGVHCRDALIGVGAGAGLTVLTLIPYLMGGFTGRHPTPSQMDLAPLLGLRGVVLTLVQALSNGMQNTLVNVFVYSAFRAIFEWATRTPIGRARWTIGGRLRMSVASSDYVFAACVILVSAALAAAGSSGAGRAVAAGENAAETALVLFVLLRAGIFAVAVMSVTSSLLDRMPIALDSASLFAAGTFTALALLFGVAVAGFRVATRAKSAYRHDRMVA